MGMFKVKSSFSLKEEGNFLPSVLCSRSFRSEPNADQFRPECLCQCSGECEGSASVATGGGRGEAQMERLVSVIKQCITAEKLCVLESGGGAMQSFSQ